MRLFRYIAFTVVVLFAGALGSSASANVLDDAIQVVDYARPFEASKYAPTPFVREIAKLGYTNTLSGQSSVDLRLVTFRVNLHRKGSREFRAISKYSTAGDEVPEKLSEVDNMAKLHNYFLHLDRNNYERWQYQIEQNASEIQSRMTSASRSLDTIQGYSTNTGLDRCLYLSYDTSLDSASTELADTIDSGPNYIVDTSGYNRLE